jgi:Bacterial Ig-like domain (group 2)
MNRRAVALGMLASTITLISCSGGAAPTQTDTTVASVTVTPTDQSLGVSQTAQLTATLKDAQGNTLSGPSVSWSTSQPATASVSNTGVVTAIAAGTATITATSEQRSGTALITVTAPVVPVATVSVSAPSTTLIPQETAQLAVVLKGADGATLTGRTITYSSSAPQTASVSASGLVTAVAVGTTTITATSEGKSGTIDLTVATGTVVGSSGGTVTGGNGAVVLTIPPGALATNTPISIVPLVGTPPAAPAGVQFNGTAYQIGTAALTFAQPVTIKLKYDAPTLPLWVMSGDMVILGSGASGWTSLSGIVVDTVAKTVSGTTRSIGGGNGGSRTSLGGATSAPLPPSTWGRVAFAPAALSAGTPPTVTIAVNPATVTLTPANDSVNPQKRSVMFHGSIVPTGSPVSVPVPGVTSPQPLWRYRWRTTGQNGVLPGGLTDTGWMDVPDIQYICTNANLSVVTGKMDDVILDVLLNPGTENNPAAQQIVRVQGSVFAGLKKTFEIAPDDVTIGPGVAQQLQFLVRDQSGNILPNNPNTRFTWNNTAFAGDLQNGATPDIQVYQAKSTFTSPPPRVDQIDAQIDGVTTVTERTTHWDFSNLIHPVLVVDATTNVTYTLQGTAHTFVTVHVNYTVSLQPGNPTVSVGGTQALALTLTPAYTGTGLAYVWNSPGTHGTLSETNGNHSANTGATYTAKPLDVGGTDQITVTVVSYLAGVELETLGTGTANIVVDPFRSASFSARQIPVNGGVSYFTSATLEIPKVAGATLYQVQGTVLGSAYSKSFSGATSTNTQSLGQVLDGGSVFYINLDAGYNTIKSAADARLAIYKSQYASSTAKYKALP